LNSVLSGFQSKAEPATFLVTGAHNKFGPDPKKRKKPVTSRGRASPAFALARAACRLGKRTKSRANEQNPGDHQIGNVEKKTQKKA
jgi:hypothetical protein